jgi:hypothetical protein
MLVASYSWIQMYYILFESSVSGSREQQSEATFNPFPRNNQIYGAPRDSLNYRKSGEGLKWLYIH